MKSLLLGLTILSLANISMAQDRRVLKEQIADLSINIERDVPYSDADLTDLQEAKDLLRDALNLVNKRGGGNSNVYKLCMNYAYEKYRRQYSDSEALQRAQNNCKTVSDMDVLQYLFEKHYRNLSISNAMDLATSQADARTEGRLELIEFAYEKHFRNVGSSEAVTKAVRNIQTLRRNRGSLACFQQYYPIHFRTNSSTVAMDKTIDTCRNL